MKYYLIFLVLLAALVIYLANQYPDALDSGGNTANIIYGLLLVSLVGSSVFIHYRGKIQQGLQHAIIWVILIIIAAVGFSQKDRIMGAILPDQPQIKSGGKVVIHQDARGQYYVRGNINNRPARFLVDTGASDIILSSADAQRAGYDVENLSYTRLYQTANGATLAAPITIAEIQIGDIIIRNIPASVSQPDDNNISLLGMTFLNKLKGFQIMENQMILYAQ